MSDTAKTLQGTPHASPVSNPCYPQYQPLEQRVLSYPAVYNRLIIKTLLYIPLRYLSPIAGLWLIGCASQPVTEAPKAPEPATPTVEKVADKQFESETLYALLVAEFAGSRKRFDVMLNNYVQQAKHTQDIEVTARASQLARYLNAHDQSLNMAQQWVQLEPHNLEAHFNAALELIQANQLASALPHASRLLAGGHDKTGFDAIAARAVQINDPALSADLASHFQTELTTYPSHVPLLVGLSLLEQHLGHFEPALNYAQRAHEINPTHFRSAAQAIRVLESMGREEEARTELGLLVERFPQNNRLRLQYARALIKADLGEAETQFLTLLKTQPNDWSMVLTTALIQYELKKFSDAKTLFLRLVDDANQPNGHRSTAHGYLGRIALIEENNVTAERHFSQVDSGSDYLPVLAKLTDLYIESGDQQKALTYLADQLKREDIDHEQQTGIFLLQSRIYKNASDFDAAINALSAPLDSEPDNTKLLYARAMLLSDRDRLAEAEKDLVHIISKDADHAAALNALGYTLADKTTRYEEAYQYIRRAYELTPDDPAVIDSLGWVEYKRGNLEAALKYLKNALMKVVDHEIAAHLGEVLWVTGQKEEALKAWKKGLAQTPGSSIIRATVERLGIEVPEQ